MCKEKESENSQNVYSSASLSLYYDVVKPRGWSLIREPSDYFSQRWIYRKLYTIRVSRVHERIYRYLFRIFDYSMHTVTVVYPDTTNIQHNRMLVK